MAQFFTDFEGDTLDQQPPGTTVRWGAAEVGAWAVREVSPGGTRYVSNPQSSLHPALSWDMADGAGDVDLVCSFDFNLDGTTRGYLVGRGGGTPIAPDGYFSWVRLNNNQRVYKTVGGTETELGTASGNRPPEPRWIRFRVQGGTMKMRQWGPSEAEPATWDVEGADADLLTGWAGLGCRFGNAPDTYRVFKLGIGTLGDVAPTEAPGGTAPQANVSTSVNGLTLTATDTSTDADGDLATVDFDFGDGTVLTGQPPGTQAVHTYAADGTYTLRLTAHDATGLSHFIEVTISYDTTAPAAPSGFQLQVADFTP